MHIAPISGPSLPAKLCWERDRAFESKLSASRFGFFSACSVIPACRHNSTTGAPRAMRKHFLLITPWPA
jgi:hypothetical protein